MDVNLQTETGTRARALFADFELDLSSGELIRNGQRVRLQGQPFLVLRVLLEAAGAVVSREELQRRLWPDATFVDSEHGLNKSVAKLRDALGECRRGSGLIETLPRRGYRLQAEVRWIDLSQRDGSAIDHKERPLTTHVGALVGAGLLFLALALWFAWHIRAESRNRLPIRSVAVMPFVNLSSDAVQDYVAASVARELSTELAHAGSLRVVSAVDSARFDGSGVSVAELARRLQVDAILRGSLERDAGRTWFKVLLIRAHPERQEWEASYERGASTLRTFEHRIAMDVMAQIGASLTPDERSRMKPESRVTPEAYDEYLRARYFLEQETAQETKAIPHLEHAMQLDPNFAEAYAALGEAWGLQGVWADKSSQQTSTEALAYSRKAVDLDASSSEAYASLGHSLMQSRRWNEGEAALRRAIQLDPNNPYARNYLSLLLVQKGRVAEALAMSRELAQAHPVTLDLQHTYAEMLYRARLYEEAIAQCRRILELDPNHLATYTTLANALTESGRYAEAESAFKTGRFMNIGVEAWLLVREGKPELARQLLHANPRVSNVHAAVALYLIGEHEAGLAELDQLANVTWAIRTYHLRNDPTFDVMRADPAFDAIVKRTGLMDH